MLMIPIKPLPAQVVTVPLNQQSVKLELYQKSTGLFMNVSVNDSLVIGGVICRNLTLIVRSLYLGFIGDLAFADVRGQRDPYYTGIGSRYYLFYLAPAEAHPSE